MKRKSKATAAKYMFYTSLVGFASSVMNKLLDYFLNPTVKEAAQFAAEGTAIRSLELAAGSAPKISGEAFLIGGTLLLTMFFLIVWKKLKEK